MLKRLDHIIKTLDLENQVRITRTENTNISSQLERIRPKAYRGLEGLSTAKNQKDIEKILFILKASDFFKSPKY
jgi:hypothetical protein